MEDINKTILWEGYGLRYYGGIRTRTGVICKTDAGPLELKKARDGSLHICFAQDIKEQLFANGFTKIARFRKTVDDAPFFVWNETTYVLEDVLPADVLEEKDIQGFEKGSSVLGQLHKHAKGLESTYGLWDSEKLPKQFAKRHSELAKIKHRIQKTNQLDALDLMVVQNYGAYMSRVEEAMAYLKEGGYVLHMEAAQQRGTFCHKSFKGSNLRVKNGVVYVAGFEHAAADTGLVDLAAYLKRYMKKTDGLEAGVGEILSAYTKVMAMEAEDFLLLQALILYPEKFLRLINELYNKRKTCISPAMKQRMKEVIAEEDKSQRLLGYLRSL
ncbi:hypothetical protein [Chakrabartyella piscis]|uniref:hypothetical protein n=1 Tax=Chakrabartyella piscis TaxID=2918914 RepID=UPI0029589236|nr:hypothetical protein [Chakrabartyella piscis]